MNSLENSKKNLVFHFESGRHASFPQKPVVKHFLDNTLILFISSNGFHHRQSRHSRHSLTYPHHMQPGDEVL